MKFLFALVTQRWHKSFQVFDTERYWKAYNGGFFFACFLRNAEACILKILSSSNRGGGVAPDCMDSALKTSFPWLQASFCLWSVRISECDTKADCKEGGGVPTTTPALLARVHLFNSGLYSMWWSFYNQLRLLIFPSLSDYFPPGELIRTLASEK